MRDVNLDLEVSQDDNPNTWAGVVRAVGAMVAIYLALAVFVWWVLR